MKPRTLEELREEVRKRGSAEVTPEVAKIFTDAMRREMDAQMEVYGERLVEMPEGWTPLKPTWRQRLYGFQWRVRGWLAAPHVWVLRWLYPGVLESDDD